ncbi:MAG: hypothetical protein JW884_00210 [Deltaproteobacteria bacterium]|nr:hypothetical protein [Deltaproteobacteria bacterium]
MVCFDREQGKAVPVVEEFIEKKMEEVVTLLQSNSGRSMLYDEILTIVDKALIKIALSRSNHVKTAAAAFLGINRNTLHKKMSKLGLDDH